jgi:predicted SprT family Zn-dependent metalloprotease
VQQRRLQVIDNEARLRTTLSHEMCHVAAWVISKEWKEHHGAVFWAWARRFEKQVHGIKITTCHNFDVHAPFRWQCSNHRYKVQATAPALLL